MKQERYFIDENSTILYNGQQDVIYKRKEWDSKEEKEKSFSSSFSEKSIRIGFAKAHAIIFEVTERCNLKCRYCTYSDIYTHHSRRNNQDLTFKKAKNLIDFFIKNKKSVLGDFNFPMSIGFYGGEPLLSIELIKKIVKYSKGIFPTVSFTLTTNALLLKKNIEYLERNNFTVTVSLDGNNFNNSFRLRTNGKSSFEKVYYNLKEIFLKMPDYAKNKIEFVCVLHKKNSVLEAHQFFKNEFNKTPFFTPLTQSFVDPRKISEFHCMYQNIQSSFQEALKEDKYLEDIIFKCPDNARLIDIFKRFDSNTYVNVFELLRKGKFRYLPTGTCFPFSRKIYLTTKGRILPCERIGDQYFFGNVTDNSLRIDFKEIAGMYNSLYHNIKEMCLNCRIFFNCGLCIFQIQNIKNHPKCPEMIDIDKSMDESVSKYLSLLEEKPSFYIEYFEKYHSL